MAPRCLLFAAAILSHAVLSTAQVDTRSQFSYQTGTITLGDNLATLSLGPAYKYLDPDQTQRVLVDLWGNPPSDKCLGMVLETRAEPTDTTSWAAILDYSDDGHVRDSDAAKTNYDKLLSKMQKQTRGYNKAREKAGYPPVDLVGWAEPPYYDSTAKKLYWAKELRFGDSQTSTLNYDVRILGRKGYLLMTVVAGMDQLQQVKPAMAVLLQAVEFREGARYTDFVMGSDKVAAYGVAGLVAGAALAKVGFFKLALASLIAFKKVIIVALIALGALLTKLFAGRKAVHQTAPVRAFESGPVRLPPGTRKRKPLENPRKTGQY